MITPQWPDIDFRPVNLWALPAAWKLARAAAQPTAATPRIQPRNMRAEETLTTMASILQHH